MRTILFVSLLILVTGSITAQRNVYIDSLKKAYLTGTDDSVKAIDAAKIGAYYFFDDPEETKKYFSQAEQIAESSRNRRIITGVYCEMAYAYNSDLTISIFGKSKLREGAGFSQKAIAIAKENRLTAELASALGALCNIQLLMEERKEAMKTAQELYNLVYSAKADKYYIKANRRMGYCYLANDNLLDGYKYLSTALMLAKESKDPGLLYPCNIDMCYLYTLLKDYEKAKDYASVIRNEFGDSAQANMMFCSISLNMKDYNAVKRYAMENFRISDSVQNIYIKLAAAYPLLVAYVATNDQEAFRLLNSNAEMVAEARKKGMGQTMDIALGMYYTALKHWDSAYYFFEQAIATSKLKEDNRSLYDAYEQYTVFFEVQQQYEKAIEMMLNAGKVAIELDDLEILLKTNMKLDSLSFKTGNIPMQLAYTRRYIYYKDSLQKLSDKRELASLEIDDDIKRKAYEAEEEHKRIADRHRAQYIGITISIIGVFLLLGITGIFKVSFKAIRILGFFSFLLFFEFVFLVFKKSIYAITGGEPLKDLAFMLLLAAVLVPLHHWIEHKVVHYLAHYPLQKTKDRFLLKLRHYLGNRNRKSES
ncbi:MAG: hypothetical protein QM731_24380 [Chitinophagaceae bacterium]